MKIILVLVYISLFVALCESDFAKLLKKKIRENYGIESKEDVYRSPFKDQVDKIWTNYVSNLDLSQQEVIYQNSAINVERRKQGLREDFYHDEDLVQNDLEIQFREERKLVLKDVVSSVKKREGEETTTDNTKFKFALDYTLWDTRRCTSVGQVLLIGYATSASPVCSVTQADNCKYTCTANDIPTANMLTFVKETLIPAVKLYFEESITMDTTGLTNPGKIKLDETFYNSAEQKCGPYSIPITYTQNEVDGYYLLFVTAQPSVDDAYIASAAPCNAEKLDGSATLYKRPLAGYLNFSPKLLLPFMIGGYNLNKFHEFVNAGVKELVHALGFHSTFIPSWKAGAITDAIVEKTRSVTNPSGVTTQVTYKLLTTKRVTAVARYHYNCPSMIGLELQGGNYISGRIAYGEVMNPLPSHYSYFSYFTMAILDDMGWYKVDHSKAERFVYGKDEGCSFVNDKCEDWNDANSRKDFFCTTRDTAAESGCTVDRKGKGTCGLTKYGSSLTASFQHFTDGTLGGTKSRDYCPQYQATEFCNEATNTANKALFEEFGKDSMCFTTQKNIPVCYEHRCNDELLEIKINERWRSCPKLGGSIELKEAKTYINCPRSSVFCQGETTNFDKVSLKTIYVGSNSKIQELIKNGEDIQYHANSMEEAYKIAGEGDTILSYTESSGVISSEFVYVPLDNEKIEVPPSEDPWRN